MTVKVVHVMFCRCRRYEVIGCGPLAVRLMAEHVASHRIVRAAELFTERASDG